MKNTNILGRLSWQSLVFVILGLLLFFNSQAYTQTVKKNTLVEGALAWSVPLNITADELSFTRTFGGDPNATDGFDGGQDVVAPPPGMTYYVYFELVDIPNYLETDVRSWVSPYNTDITWKLQVIKAMGKTSTVTWDPANLPSNDTFTLEGANGPIDMRNQNSVTFSGDKTLTIRYHPTPPVGWTVPLNITYDDMNITRTFGGNPGATDGFDSGQDEVAPPPGMTYYAYFEIPDIPYYLKTDIRAWISPYDAAISWTLQVIKAMGKTTTVTWDPANLPPEDEFIMEGVDESIDMRTQSSVTFSGDKVLFIKYGILPSITITYPNGGEELFVGSNHDITWTSSDFTDPVKIEYSIDGGTTWLSPPIAESTDNDGSHPWTIPNTPSADCKVRISDAADGDPEGVSDDVFTIALPPAITVTAPNGGEKLLVGSDYDITWTSTSFTDPVKIEYSTDGGATWLSPPIAESTDNDGSHPWTIPDTPSADCKVRISDAADGDPSDVSDDIFAITLSPIQPIVSSPQSAGTEFWVDIKVGNTDLAVSDLFGLNFDCSFTQTDYINVVTPYPNSIVQGDFLGDDIIFFSKVDEATGKVSIGMTRKASVGGVSGDGVVARIKFISRLDTPDKTSVDFSISNVMANDPANNPIILAPILGNVMIQAGPVPVIVWPGDTNNDGIVNTVDILPIGLYFCCTGPVRQGASSDWVGQLCLPWAPVPKTYADADGNGTINTEDVLPIDLNYGKTWTSSSTKSNFVMSKNNSMLRIPTIKPEVNFISADTFRVDINVRNVNGLFGLAFDLIYSQKEYISPIAVKPDLYINTDLMYHIISKDEGKVSVGVSRKVGQEGVNDCGTVIQILMCGNTTAPLGSQVDLSLKNVVANDPSGKSIDFTVENTEFITTVELPIESSAEMPTQFELSQNYPNPFNPRTQIQFQIPKTTQVVLKIFDVLGHEIVTLVNGQKPAGYYEIVWNGRDRWGKKVTSGIYIYKLEAGDFTESKKMILMQ